MKLEVTLGNSICDAQPGKFDYEFQYLFFTSFSLLIGLVALEKDEFCVLLVLGSVFDILLLTFSVYLFDVFGSTINYGNKLPLAQGINFG